MKRKDPPCGRVSRGVALAPVSVCNGSPETSMDDVHIRFDGVPKVYVADSNITTSVDPMCRCGISVASESAISLTLAGHSPLLVDGLRPRNKRHRAPSCNSSKTHRHAADEGAGLIRWAIDPRYGYSSYSQKTYDLRARAVPLGRRVSGDLLFFNSSRETFAW